MVQQCAPFFCPACCQAGELGEDRGALQKALAAFIAQRPKGTVLITDFDKVGPRQLAWYCMRAGHGWQCYRWLEGAYASRGWIIGCLRIGHAVCV